MLAQYRRTATVGRRSAAHAHARWPACMDSCAPRGRCALLSQGDDTTAPNMAPLLLPVVADAAELVGRELAPDEPAHEVAFVRVPIESRRVRRGAAVTVSAVRSSQPPAGLAMRAVEACSMQLVYAEDNEEFRQALLLKYAPRYVVQRCNSRVATYEAEMQRMGVSSGGALFKPGVLDCAVALQHSALDA